MLVYTLDYPVREVDGLEFFPLRITDRLQLLCRRPERVQCQKAMLPFSSANKTSNVLTGDLNDCESEQVPRDSGGSVCPLRGGVRWLSWTLGFSLQIE